MCVYRHLDNICQAVMLQFTPNLDFDEFEISQETKTVSVTGKTLCYSKPKYKPYKEQSIARVITFTQEKIKG